MVSLSRDFVPYVRLLLGVLRTTATVEEALGQTPRDLGRNISS